MTVRQWNAIVIWQRDFTRRRDENAYLAETDLEALQLYDYASRP